MAVVGNRHTGWHVLPFDQQPAFSTHVALHPSARKPSSSHLGLAIDLSSRFFDVPTFFGRDISRFREFASHWYGDSPKLAKSVSLPKVSFKHLLRLCLGRDPNVMAGPDFAQDSLPSRLSSYSQRGPDEACRFICPGS